MVDVKLTPGNCTCNEPLLDQLADTYVKALPIIAEVLAPLEIILYIAHVLPDWV